MAAIRWVCVSLLCLVTCQLCISSSQFHPNSGPTQAATHSQFARHRTFRPSVYHGREKRQLQHTRHPDGHVNELSIFYTLDNDSYILDLRLNRDLLPDGYFEKYHENGEQVTRRTNGSTKNLQLCQYQGQIRHVPESWAALSTCAGLSGVIFDGHQLHYVEPHMNGSSLDDEHLWMKHSDLTANFSCGTHSALPHSSHSHPRVKRETENPSSNPTPVKGPFKANSRSRYVELVLVVDNKSYESHDKDLQRVYRRCKDIANIVNALYAPLNIFVALVGIVVWSEKDEIQISVKGDETLTNFLHYRRVRLSKEHPNDNAQLLTGIQFQGGVVGKALKGPMCTYEFSGGVAMDHSPTVGLVATTVAHEMGHNFGMEHDNDSLCHCPDDKCIMAASSSAVSPTHWSSCSLENLALAFEHGMDYCLRNKPISLFESPECGNMFVEDGEECDCGLPERCDNPCCNPHTCKLHVNATCATGDCCDTTTCRLKNAGSPCRSALQECDLPEYCTGKSEFCPGDLHKLDGTSCGQDKAYCYEGSCRSHSDQCRLLWGPSGKGSDAKCYDQNTHGNKTGNCGYLKFNDTFTKCRDENIQCGLLHCSHLNERLEFGMESVAVLSHSFFNVEGKIIPCRTANVDLGLQDVDPGLVPNGAKCGHNKMCVDQRCVAVSSVIKAGCPHKCGINGECNNLGKCHCKVGFDPPHCQHFGAGGSEDGGPASDPDVRSSFVVAMFIIFLGIFPSLVLAFCCWYCCRDRRQRNQLWAKILGGPKLSLPTRGSPDFTQPPSSNSSTTSSPSRRIAFPGNILCPVSWWSHKSSGNPVPADDPASISRGNGPKLEISRPMPIRPSKLGVTGNGSNTNQQSRPPPTSVAHNLIGQYRGATLSPLPEQADSSFDSFDSAESLHSTTAAPPPLPMANSASSKPNGGSIVAARTNFFSNGTVQSSTPATASVPVRPAPAVPPAQQQPSSVTGKHQPAAPVPTLGHTEIIISKTIVPSSTNGESIQKTTDVSVKPTGPQKVRPLSTSNNYNIKTIFNRTTEPSQATPSNPTFVAGPAAQQVNNTSTLQKMKASLFKAGNAANSPQVSPNASESSADKVDGPVSGGSTLPRHQSIKATKINRESLRGLEISNPIPQNVIELPSKVVPVRPAPAPPPTTSAPSTEASPPAQVHVPPPASTTAKLGISSTLPRLPKSGKVHFAEDSRKEEESDPVAAAKKPAIVVERSESMRLRGVTSRPNIPQFGSMRAKRPVSMPFARPTSPPPNPPGLGSATSPILETDYSYDDCSALAQPEEDAIYASIEDLGSRDVSLLKKDDAGSTTTTNSDGLLSEIVCELKKKNLDDVYSVAMKKKNESASSTAVKSTKPQETVVSSAATTTTTTPKTTSFTPLSKNNPTTLPSNTQLGSKPVVSTSATTTTSQGYKPYSSSMASRGRYFGTSTATTTFGSVSVANSVATPTGSSSSVVTTTPSVQTAPVMSTNVNPPKIASNITKPALAAPKEPSTRPEKPNGSVANPIPLPKQPPVGKLPVVSTAQSSATSSFTGSVTKPNTAMNGTTTPSTKRPMSPSAEVDSAKPGIHLPANVKSKAAGQKTTAPPLASKNPAILAKSGTAGGAPKVTKPSATNLTTFRSTTASTTTPTTTSSAPSKPITSVNSIGSTSSPGGAHLATSGKTPSSSHVHTMQQKFDASNAGKGPIVSNATSTKNVSNLPTKSKTNPKR